jgi:hypothetical protein
MPTENNGWKPNGLDRLMIEVYFHHQIFHVTAFGMASPKSTSGALEPCKLATHDIAWMRPRLRTEHLGQKMHDFRSGHLHAEVFTEIDESPTPTLQLADIGLSLRGFLLHY